MIEVIRRNQFEIYLVAPAQLPPQAYPVTITNNEARDLIVKLRKVLGDPHTQDDDIVRETEK